MSGSATCEEFVDLAAAAAVDALDADEARQVEQHAALCPACATALDELREAAAVLGAEVPQVDPPPALRARLLEVAAQEARPVPRRQRAWSWPWPWRLRLPRPAPAWVAAAASVALSIVALARVAALQAQVSELQTLAAAERERAARYDQVVDVLASDRLAIKTLQPVGEVSASRGMVYLDLSSGTGMVMCHNLPPIESGHVWQVWFVRGSERVSAGMLWPDGYGNGYTLISVPRDLQSFDSIGVTNEPANDGRGSAWPTTPRIMGTVLNGTTQ